jgi:hypothetical protein
MINSGSQALLRGTQLEPPHAGCLLDLGWLLCYKGLDQMALFYLDKSAAIVPHSRDILALQGWASIGSGNREEALESFRKAVNEPEATEGDRQTLRELENGKCTPSLGQAGASFGKDCVHLQDNSLAS